jgi:hypothetical protein
MSAKWDFWIDRGGTFTYVIAAIPTGVCTRTSSCLRIQRRTGTLPCMG